MKTLYSLSSHIFFVTVLSIVSTPLLHGLAQSTLVTTPHGLIPIEQLRAGDTVIAYQDDGTLKETPIISINRYTTNRYYSLTNEERQICIHALPKQYFLTASSSRWIPARSFRSSSPLTAVLTDEESFICTSANKEAKPKTFFILHLPPPHTFLITEYQIVAHNELFSMTCGTALLDIAFSFGGGEIIFEGIKIGLLGLLGLGFQCVSKLTDTLTDTVTFQDSNKKEKNKETPDTKKKHDNETCDPEECFLGEIDEAKYHHKNSKGKKSPCAKDSIKSLHESIPDGDRHRIAIQDDDFVVIRETREGVYHTHVRPWEKLENKTKSNLIKNKITNRDGKILQSK
ncbi:MAG: hypothetical protein WBQ73_00160 [Candidatus Babeliales bacterium]